LKYPWRLTKAGPVLHPFEGFASDRKSPALIGRRNMIRLWYRFRKKTLDRPTIKIAIAIGILAVVSAAGLYLFEREVTDSPYHSIPSTFRSVFVLLFSGFDINMPTTGEGQAFAFLAMILGIALVALITADLASYLVTLALTSAGKSIMLKNHVLICGWGGRDSYIIDSIISQVRGQPVVVLDKELNDAPVQDPYVEFVKGDPSESKALQRANCNSANTVIIPLNWEIGDRSVRDSVNVLTMLAVESITPDLYTCVEVSHENAKRHLARTEANEVVCAGEISRKIIVQAALKHGISRLLLTLLRTYPEPIIRVRRIPEDYCGRLFGEFYRHAYRSARSIIMAIERVEGADEDGNEGEVLFHLCPSDDYILCDGDLCVFLVEERSS
jgi:voltage-gated potassium channel